MTDSYAPFPWDLRSGDGGSPFKRAVEQPAFELDDLLLELAVDCGVEAPSPLSHHSPSPFHADRLTTPSRSRSRCLPGEESIPGTEPQGAGEEDTLTDVLRDLEQSETSQRCRGGLRVGEPTPSPRRDRRGAVPPDYDVVQAIDCHRLARRGDAVSQRREDLRQMLSLRSEQASRLGIAIARRKEASARDMTASRLHSVPVPASRPGRQDEEEEEKEMEEDEAQICAHYEGVQTELLCEARALEAEIEKLDHGREQ